MHVNETVTFLTATSADLPEIVALLADDVLGRHRESQSIISNPEYTTAFNEISADPNNELIVGKINGKVIATLQITYIPNLTLKGAKRAQIEGVRVSSSVRRQGVGKKLFQYALDSARKQNCRLAQLTTNKSRPGAFRFYEDLGFQATHEGFKLEL